MVLLWGINGIFVFRVNSIFSLLSSDPSFYSPLSLRGGIWTPQQMTRFHSSRGIVWSVLVTYHCSPGQVFWIIWFEARITLILVKTFSVLVTLLAKSTVFIGCNDVNFPFVGRIRIFWFFWMVRQTFTNFVSEYVCRGFCFCTQSITR